MRRFRCESELLFRAASHSFRKSIWEENRREKMKKIVRRAHENWLRRQRILKTLEKIREDNEKLWEFCRIWNR